VAGPELLLQDGAGLWQRAGVDGVDEEETDRVMMQSCSGDAWNAARRRVRRRYRSGVRRRCALSLITSGRAVGERAAAQEGPQMTVARRLYSDFISFEADLGAHSRPMAANAADELERQGGACETPTYDLVDRPRPGVGRAFSDIHRAGWAALHRVADYYGCPAAVPPTPTRPSPLWGGVRLTRARQQLEQRIGALETQARGVETQAHIVCLESATTSSFGPSAFARTVRCW
jgi:hypothetical protein